jgi:succinoglycan biosynthesis transport protein ExoP
MDQSIKSVEQAEQVLQLPVLAAIPAAEPDGLEVKNRLIMKGSSNSSCSESFRSLRVNIESMNRSKSSKVVVFTSSMPSEGKTFTSINYAASLAQQGHKTLLIDMDLRKPAVAKDFGIEMSKYVGLTEIITSDEKLEQFPEFPVYQAAEGLSVLHGGPLIDNPAERLSSYAIERIVEKAREHFDRVVIDSAPLGPVGDTLTVARLADMVCLVVRSDKTPSKVILRIIDTLHRHGHTPAGIVLNFMKVKTGYGSYYYYYSSDKQPEITSEKPPYKRKSGDVADSNIASTQLGESGGLEESEPKKNQIPPELESMLKAKQEYTRSDKSVESRPSV